jgi:hypothetical protein
MMVCSLVLLLLMVSAISKRGHVRIRGRRCWECGKEEWKAQKS